MSQRNIHTLLSYDPQNLWASRQWPNKKWDGSACSPFLKNLAKARLAAKSLQETAKHLEISFEEGHRTQSS